MHQHPIELVEKRVNEFKDNHSYLGPTCLIPGLALTDMNRGQMFTAHCEQRLQIKEPQPPLWFTGYENEWGKYSSGYEELEGEWKVLTKIIKNDFNYVMIVKKLKNSKKEINKLKKGIKPTFCPGEYHVIQRMGCVHLTEKYGYEYDNKVIDSLNKGDIIKSGTVLFKDNNRDEDMNLTYGRNLNACYLTYGGMTNEDSIVISESAAIKMGHYEVKIIEVSLNTNDIFVNLYGDKKFYKGFPNIGEKCKDGLLAATRRINYSTAPISLADTIGLISDDVKYRGNGTVIDVQVISNIDNPEEVLDSTYNKQIKKYYMDQQNYYNNFVKYIQPIVTNKDNKVSKDLIDLYNYYCRLIDPNNKFLVGDNLFDHLKLKFVVLKKTPLVVGSKIAGRYGNKGVISAIIPDDEMPQIEDFAGLGKPDPNSKINFKIDVLLNPLGVINRLNPSQNIETEMNYNSKVIRYIMEKNMNKWSLEKEKNYLLKYLKVVDAIEYSKLKSYFETLDDDSLKELLEEIIEKGIPIHQPPINNAKNIVDLANVYNYTKADRSTLSGITNTVICGEIYMMTLKHIPASKFSARSVDQLSIKNIPVKSNLYKQYKADYSTNAIKIGEMENIGLALANPANKNAMQINKYYLDAFANNEKMRMDLLEAQLSDNPYSFNIEPSETRSENSKILRTFLNCMQLDIEEDEVNFEE